MEKTRIKRPYQCLPSALAARDVAADDTLDDDLSDDDDDDEGWAPDGCGGCCHMADDRMELAFAFVFALAFDREGDAVALAREAGRSADFRVDDDDDDDDADDDDAESEDNACGIRARVAPTAAGDTAAAAAAAPLAFVLPVAANSEKAADVSWCCSSMFCARTCRLAAAIAAVSAARCLCSCCCCTFR
jgi:hypothetical protein